MSVRTQKRKLLKKMERQEKAIQTGNNYIKHLRKRLIDAHDGLQALLKRIPEEEWAAILGGMDNPDARKLLTKSKKLLMVHQPLIDKKNHGQRNSFKILDIPM